MHPSRCRGSCLARINLIYRWNSLKCRCEPVALCTAGGRNLQIWFCPWKSLHIFGYFNINNWFQIYNFAVYFLIKPTKSLKLSGAELRVGSSSTLLSTDSVSNNCSFWIQAVSRTLLCKYERGALVFHADDNFKTVFYSWTRVTSQAKIIGEATA